MPEYTITLTDAEVKAIATRHGDAHGDISAWLQGYMKHIAGQLIDRFVEEFSEYQPRKKTDEEKRLIVVNTTVADKL